ncbi:TPA: filamentous hemagglutinin N-terminal domain-containing protein [Raoultella planticola]|uniref:two-partner secretion domain-containing protein n=1 Tax=Raoultella planticola TaxID=575 RepID=UPI001A1B5093|nr:filamentous hemagglutinin N-terminal domain-containing protein [Raoultella planticola]
MFKFKISYIALAAALTSTFASADPSSYTHTSGTKVIDIEKPNAAGVSHNMYREFNVDSKGVLLNNSGTDSVHGSFGNMPKNNNLTAGNAKVILNEVLSNKASTLNGFIEVNGQKADVIVANPNGITCSGCSFINTNKSILTTGKVALSETGAIDKITVTGGKITVKGTGMEAADSYVMLLADAIAINSTVNAKNALISAGNATITPETGVVTSAEKTAGLMETLFPQNSIDISQLGGIKANSIKMVGNNLGFGVRNSGTIATNNQLIMTSYGTLTNEGTIASKGAGTQFVAVSGFSNSGSITTDNATLVKSGGWLTNKGTIHSDAQLQLSAQTTLENKGTAEGLGALTVAANTDITNYAGAKLVSNGQVMISALNNVDNAGSVAGQNITAFFSGSDLRSTGSMTAGNNVIIQSVKEETFSTGAINNAGTLSGTNIALQTLGDISQTGSVEAVQALVTSSSTLTNSGDMAGNYVNVSNSWTNNSGNIQAGNMDITASRELLNDGTLSANNNMSLITGQDGTIVNHNSINAAGTLVMTTGKVVNGGYRCGFMNWSTCGVGTLTANQLNLTSSQSYAQDMGGKQNFKYTSVNTVK